MSLGWLSREGNKPPLLSAKTETETEYEIRSTCTLHPSWGNFTDALRRHVDFKLSTFNAPGNARPDPAAWTV